ncbi:MAG: glutamine--fructose-6-phosphate transaminase (isomerizing) [Clostridiales bacterium]|jgi:glucosamine--fructose-6-phosphate aminotransferase (isomerizing)|nr:glutamine--fructose-6-phosphate transaminase (isomerizing) [Clostridiales bacterium]MDR2711982.1 glutamine--fructose-6-phosphate transaminase (isomerizing) [Clostridiales bacterium]
MCGIVGYVGNRQALPIILQGLKSLEYRGYDSAGVVIVPEESGEELNIIRSQGKIAHLENVLEDYSLPGTVGIGHTRWATHGPPSDANAHPHCDCQKKIALAHNGIIENYLELQEWLIEKGHSFTSETDTEVLPHLVEEFYQGDLGQALQEAIKRLRGAYAIVAVCRDNPDILVAARKDSPLIIGIGEGENFFASDIPAVIEHTRQIIIMEDGETAQINREGAIIYKDGQPIAKKITKVDWTTETAKKGGYPHFMLKEIHEQPDALRHALKGRIMAEENGLTLIDHDFAGINAADIEKIAIVACGTSYHAGLVGKYVIEKMLRLPVDVDIASEYRYRDPIIDEKTLVIVISQSGETADTLAALRESKKRGAPTLAICNVLGSSISREADQVVYTLAGPEIAVASTKAYTTQLMLIYLLTLHLGRVFGKISPEELEVLLEHIYRLPDQLQNLLAEKEEDIKKLAALIIDWGNAFFIGRGIDYAVSLEGSLKLKEISYIHAEAYASGELKHGTLALIEEGIPVLAICTQRALLEKSLSNIKEVKARNAFVIAMVFEGSDSIIKEADRVFTIPDTLDILAPVLTIAPLQLLSYYAAVMLGCNVDQPRNLAKSVTVE